MGRCRGCGSKISPQYPLVELFSGVLIVLLFERFGWSVEMPVYYGFISALLAASLIDLKYRIIPDRITLLFMALGLVLSPFVLPVTFTGSVAGILLGGGVLFLIAYLYYLFKKTEGMGGGDIKLLAMIGAFIGWKGAFFTLFLGSFTGALVGGILILAQGRDAKYAVPFGPFLSFGAFIYLIWGKGVVNWYLSLMAF